MKNFTYLLFALLLIIACVTVNAQTNVSGGIYTNTTWTKANSPYIVTDTVVVFPNDTLTIEAGVTVKFHNNIGLIVRGSIIASGTVTDSIAFTSSSASPSPGTWIALNIADTVEVNLSYCNFNYATDGVNVSSGSLVVTNSTFRNNNNGIEASGSLVVTNSIFSNNENGISVLNGAYINVENSTFSSNGTGVSVDGFSTLDSCIFRNNGTGVGGNSFAITANNCIISNNNSGVGGEFGGAIHNCVIDSNTTCGICNAADEGGETYLDSCEINNNGTAARFEATASFENCTINNNQSGIFIVTAVEENGSTIRNCILTHNKTIAVELEDIGGQADSIVNCQINHNGTGIDNEFDGGIRVVMNDIENNALGINFIASNSIAVMNVIQNDSVGMVLGTTPYSIYCNKICSNLSYDLIYKGVVPCDISDNYWCTTDSATIQSHIYDGHDNIDYGLVTFEPFDTVGCYLTGCDVHISVTVTNATCDTCHNGSATAIVTNNSGNVNYSWYTSPIQTGQTVRNLASGKYTVCVSDANGCAACDSSVFVDSTNCTGFSVVANATNASCLSCATGTAFVNVNNGTPPYHYTWYAAPVQTIDTATNLLPGQYLVCVSDLYGCIACDSVSVGTGNCSAYFELYADTSVLHTYIAVNEAFGAGVLHYDWNWGDSSPDDTTPYPNHTYASPGFYTICLTIIDSAGCSSNYCNGFVLQRTTNTMIYVMVVPPVVTGVNEYAVTQSIYIYPNPATDHLTLILPETNNKGELKIYNLLGEHVLDAYIKKQNSDINVSGLANGVYILETIVGSEISRQKFVKE